jgi:hypothetical protein
MTGPVVTSEYFGHHDRVTARFGPLPVSLRTLSNPVILKLRGRRGVARHDTLPRDFRGGSAEISAEIPADTSVDISADNSAERSADIPADNSADMLS